MSAPALVYGIAGNLFLHKRLKLSHLSSVSRSCSGGDWICFYGSCDLVDEVRNT